MAEKDKTQKTTKSGKGKASVGKKSSTVHYQTILNEGNRAKGGTDRTGPKLSHVEKKKK